MQALIKNNADLTAIDKFGETALHKAVRCTIFSCPTGVITFLLEVGADAKAKNKKGKSPWDLAQENQNLEDTKAYWELNDAQYE